MTEVRWERLKAADLRHLARAHAAVVLPVASIEQHGPHLPVMTDTRIGHEIAVRAASKASATRPAVVTPVVWSGLSEHHMAFGGTLTLSPETFFAVLRDIVGSLVRHGFRDVMISNSHGGNHVAMLQAAERLERETAASVVAVTYVYEAASGFAKVLEDQTQVQHACEAETAMMLAMEPELVDTGDLGSLAAATDVAFLRVGEASYRWRPFEHVTWNGVIGDPSKATAEKGEQLLDIASNALAGILCDPAVWAPRRNLRPDD